MKRVCVIFLAVLLLPSAGLFAQSRTEKPNDISLELLGRCGLYSMSYQRMLGKTFGLEVGASVVSLGEFATTFLFGGGRLYLSKNNASPTLAGGISYYSEKNYDSGPYFYISLGFEYRTSGGFLIRAGVFFLLGGIIDEQIGKLAWPGVSFGITF